MTRHLGGRLLLSAVAIAAGLGGFLADWSLTHLLNESWPPHAKFHNAQTMSAGAFMAVLALFFLWRRAGDHATNVLAAVLFAGGTYWTNGRGLPLPRRSVDRPRVPPARPEPRPLPSPAARHERGGRRPRSPSRLAPSPPCRRRSHGAIPLHTRDHPKTDRSPSRPDHPIDPMFLNRWSPRAFSGEGIEEADLLTILEAARWAPSSYNSQPWRFLYARRGTAQWEGFLDLLVPFNRGWAKNAGALVILVSNPLMCPLGAEQDVPSHSHSLDAGTASGFLALQANQMGWFVHGMVGFDMDRAAALLNVPTGYRVEAAYAIGRRGDPESLPDMLRAREAPSDRKPLGELASEGGFPSH